MFVFESFASSFCFVDACFKVELFDTNKLHCFNAPLFVFLLAKGIRVNGEIVSFDAPPLAVATEGILYYSMTRQNPLMLTNKLKPRIVRTCDMNRFL